MSVEELRDQVREKKREQFTNPEHPKKPSRLVVATIAVIVLAGVLYFTLAGSTEEAPTAVAGRLRIPVADLNDGKARFFNHTLENNRLVRFFVIRSADGVYRSALDACDVCFHAKKGYSQRGQDLICNHCGLSFHSTLINEVSGGCNPVGLPNTIEGDYLIIRTADLEKGDSYF